MRGLIQPIHVEKPGATTQTPGRPSIPTTTPTIRCQRCCGDGRELADVYVGTRDGQPLYRLTPQDCARCQGRGYLAYHALQHRKPRPTCGETP